MTLEEKIAEVLNSGMPLVNLEGISRAYKQNPIDYKTIANYALILRPELALDKGALNAVANELVNLSPAALKQNMDTRQSELETQVSEAMSKNYAEIVKDIDEDMLFEMALSVSGKSKKYEDIVTYLKEGELEIARKEYASTFKEKSWQDFIANKASENFVRKFAPAYFNWDSERFAMEFTEEKEVEGKKVQALNSDKIRDYLNGKLSEAKDDKAKGKFYLLAGKGLAYYQIKALAQEEAEKKKSS